MIQGLIARLSADAGVQPTIPGGIYPVLLPQDATFPCATYQVISTVPGYSLSGKAGVEDVRVQIDAWSNTTYAAAQAAQQAIRACLESFTGDLSDGTHVLDIRVANVTDYYDAANLSFRVQTDYIVQFNS